MNLKTVLIFLILLFSCTTKKQSNFNVSDFKGIDLDGNEVQLSAFNTIHRIAINVYSPTCIPCVKEIPVLNHIYSRIQNEKIGLFYMVVDPYTVVDESEKMSIEEVTIKAKEVMKKEVSDKKINLPILIMKKPFEVLPNTGLITGTPETLLFKTNPLNLYYNFIGPISEEQDETKIKSDLKVSFFINTMKGN